MAKILVVDDAKFLRTALATILRKKNHEIVGEAENGKEAVRLYQELEPDIVTMDITMPVMNGIDATKKIIDIDPNASVIMCSAMGQQKVVVEAIELGAKDFIVKPFDENRIYDAIDRVLHLKF
ncbi:MULTISPECIES: response regulator [Virgibacillus]|uniref:Chemotaxis protein CheY n=1 Tax=Virgibacillus pantothenticus TaxID=1473 RepID=A0A0L0QNZ6_VIRPA|nr:MULTISPECIES: response regulator [Virgibacillus]API94022.1 two-component system response regulator [Virgibacillus sp. 6R]KNE20274.1 chemotaxis protein CheY [Virgibacillus pantothenticus]MBS7429388.1 response regulator [Virgibacillus sp. 19R1-5]MBU8568095.1 response regulator [Virgibacillus pantothenticus]MBU8602041.1 response regulator [Virgibacillus pantothenticus]